VTTPVGNELPLSRVVLRDGFWGGRQRVNRERALVHQWEQLERTGTIDNFRIVAGRRAGRRRGFFYTDSDAHKWAEAVGTVLATGDEPRLRARVREYVALLRAAAEADGYLFTYNQLHFPGTRWVNLQIEHELYTLGHLIEAGLALEAAGEPALLELAQRTADLVVREFRHGDPLKTPGHEEIEIALLKLFRRTANPAYRETAAALIERRGRARCFGLHLLAQLRAHRRRAAAIRQLDGGAPAERDDFDFTENLQRREPRGVRLRLTAAALSGRLLQQHAPIRTVDAPVGHAVRWGYLATAAAMLARDSADAALLAALTRAWDRMVTRRLYVTGGVGALPLVEGFGRDYELNNATAYGETCAAIASVLWSWQMLLATGNARFADLLEWQLHNAVGVGMALDGCAYLYRNPLESAGDTVRRPWFRTACCPSNISRLFAGLGRFAVTASAEGVFVHQYLGGTLTAEPLPGVRVVVESGLPWESRVTVEVTAAAPIAATVQMRIPSWTDPPRMRCDGAPVPLPAPPAPVATASGYSPYASYYVAVRRCWSGRSRIEMDLSLPIRAHRADPRVRANRGKVALSRGPIVYCLESVDNPDAAIPGAAVDLRDPPQVGEVNDTLGCPTLRARDRSGRPLVFVPYFAWANRGPSCMQVWVRLLGAA
jgi:hypothetical protein